MKHTIWQQQDKKEKTIQSPYPADTDILPRFPTSSHGSTPWYLALSPKESIMDFKLMNQLSLNRWSITKTSKMTMSKPSQPKLGLTQN